MKNSKAGIQELNNGIKMCEKVSKNFSYLEAPTAITSPALCSPK